MKTFYHNESWTYLMIITTVTAATNMNFAFNYYYENLNFFNKL